jgi:hypothetical protein
MEERLNTEINAGEELGPCEKMDKGRDVKDH